MGLNLGNTNIGEIYLGNTKIAEAYLGSSKIYSAAAPVDPYNPLGLPANTVRVRTSDGNAPRKGSYTSYETATLVQGTSDIYDVYKSGTNFSGLFNETTNIVEVLGANTTGITIMGGMFYGCTSLTSVPLIDTSSVTNMSGMFYGCSSLTTVALFNTSSVTSMAYMFYVCSSLTSIPLFDTSNVTDMQYMFYNCRNVETGALALYQQASTQFRPPSSHNYTFTNCGSYTQTGQAELAQIPSDWK